jgi:hypothetical protein
MATAMREWTDAGARVIVALLVGAGLVALAVLADAALPPNNTLDALGGWPLLMSLAALLCGVAALGMSLGPRVSHRWRRDWRGAWRLTVAALAASALAWGVCLSAEVSARDWARVLAGAPLLANAATALAAAGGLVVAWLLLLAALAGLLAGLRHEAPATVRALTPLWLTPLWGAGAGVVYGLLSLIVYTPPPFHSYGLPTSPWDGLRVALPLGVGAGLILGFTLAVALRAALIARPTWDEYGALA